MPANFQSTLGHRRCHNVREKRIACHDYVGARHSDTNKSVPESLEELVQISAVLLVKDCEPRQRCSLVPIERWRDAPNPAAPVTKFTLLPFGILDQTIGRIGNYRMDRAGFTLIEPIEAIRRNNLSRACRDGQKLNVAIVDFQFFFEPIPTAIRPFENFWNVQIEI